MSMWDGFNKIFRDTSSGAIALTGEDIVAMRNELRQPYMRLRHTYNNGHLVNDTVILYNYLERCSDIGRYNPCVAYDEDTGQKNRDFKEIAQVLYSRNCKAIASFCDTKERDVRNTIETYVSSESCADYKQAKSCVEAMTIISNAIEQGGNSR